MQDLALVPRVDVKMQFRVELNKMLSVSSQAELSNLKVNSPWLAKELVQKQDMALGSSVCEDTMVDFSNVTAGTITSAIAEHFSKNKNI